MAATKPRNGDRAQLDMRTLYVQAPLGIKKTYADCKFVRGEAGAATTMLRTGAKESEAETAVVSKTPEPCRRIILLSGSSRVRGNTVRMYGTLLGSEDGDIEGEIQWTNVDTPGFRPGLTGIELVRGTASPMELQFQGYRIDRPFVKERYRLILIGAAEVGVFRGTSEAYGVWDACLSGTYQVVIEQG